ncbi:MAG TPA: hypothetical protein VFK05_09615 [Polyangiaceae bacterium]|nr:hypothetical protein [Polyangiaceae bacterium]
MKSSSGLRIAVIAALCVQPFSACTNADVDFTISEAGRSARAGSSGKDVGVAGSARAGSAASAGDASSVGGLGDAGETGMAGDNADGGTTSVAGQSGNTAAGRGGASGGGGSNGGSAGRAGGGSGGKGGAGAGGVSGGGAGGKAGAGGGGAGGKAGGGAGGVGGGAGGAGAAGAGASGGGVSGAGGASPVCGNQLLEKGEQCDDGNTKSLDACSATCTFEQSQRATSIEQRFRTSSLCPKNAFGAAFEGIAQTALQAALDERVANGSLSLLFAFPGLRDLSGMSAETFELGMAFGAPSVAASYDGTSDLDWWYTPATGQVDGSGVLYSSSTAQLSEGVLDAEPGSLRIPLLSDVAIYVSNVKLRLTVGDTSAPLTSSGTAPGHLASEHLRANLVSFASAGPPHGNDAGQLCGSLSAASLASVAIPADYATGGDTPCKEGYAAARSFLDLLVGGCTVDGDEIVASTQPDQADPDAPVAGAGAPYRLIANSSNAVTACRDKKDDSVTLARCLNAAAYSSAYRLGTGRVIIK